MSPGHGRKGGAGSILWGLIGTVRGGWYETPTPIINNTENAKMNDNENDTKNDEFGEIFTQYGLRVVVVAKSPDETMIRVRYDDPEMGDENGTERIFHLIGLRGRRLFDAVDAAPVIGWSENIQQIKSVNFHELGLTTPIDLWYYPHVGRCSTTNGNGLTNDGGRK